MEMPNQVAALRQPNTLIERKSVGNTLRATTCGAAAWGGVAKKGGKGYSCYIFMDMDTGKRGNVVGVTTAANTDEASIAHASLLSAKQESLDIARTANILIETTKVLVRGTELSEEEKLPEDLDIRTLQRLLPQVDVTRIVGKLLSVHTVFTCVSGLPLKVSIL